MTKYAPINRAVYLKKEFYYLELKYKSMGFDEKCLPIVNDYAMDLYLLNRENKIPKHDSKVIAIKDTVEELIKQYEVQNDF